MMSTEKDGKTMCIKRDIEETTKFVKENGPACTIKEVNQWTSPRFPFDFELVQQDEMDQD